MTKRKRIETGKKVLGAVLVYCLAYLTAILIGWFMGLEGAAEMAGIIAGMVTLIVSGYYLKAARENVSKYGKKKEEEKEC